MMYVKEHTGTYRPATAEELRREAVRSLNARCRRGAVMKNPSVTASFLKLTLDKTHECFAALYLDARHRRLEFVEHFHGTIDGTSVHPRVVVKHALDVNAAAVILAHNHPSGIAEPSEADKSITRRLMDALELVDVRVLDHFIVAAGNHVSFAERGLL